MLFLEGSGGCGRCSIVLQTDDNAGDAVPSPIRHSDMNTNALKRNRKTLYFPLSFSGWEGGGVLCFVIAFLY